MPNIRSVNKNHKRVLAAQVARDKLARQAAVVETKPVPAEV